MPIFVYIKDQSGIHPVILYENDGVTGPKVDLSSLQHHEITDEEAAMGIDKLCRLHKYRIRLFYQKK